ncbi:hypothetical protein PL11201_410045 [Planktothrix sp. PCC 11201]|uniref:hypothetical protein n=1 Tax=Planktothrix sp. PCC 11201 TaxID=1729650 RepID=UPI00090F0E0E|nr:hypothetical protein [Planktothrix sp. PCC 11201]SKB12631.1 hypothetical protein PL11201_410045 [Planktothrix sp. PCC 11201]
MSKSDPKNPSNSAQSGDGLEIVSISIDELQAKTSNSESLSQDKLDQVAENINANLENNQDSNWQVKNSWDETRIQVNLDLKN